MLLYVIFCATVGFVYPAFLYIFSEFLIYNSSFNTFLVLIVNYMYIVTSLVLLLLLFNDVTRYSLIPIIFFAALFSKLSFKHAFSF
jgi:hypothetical protein